MSSAEKFDFLLYEELDDGRIVRITLNRPEARNAQNRGLLVELDDAFARAEADDDVRVVILAGAGKAFSAGHDMGTEVHRRESTPGPDAPGLTAASPASCASRQTSYARWSSSGSGPVANVRVQSEQ